MKLLLLFLLISLAHCNSDQNPTSDDTPEETSINRKTTDTTVIINENTSQNQNDIDPQELARTAYCQLFDNLSHCFARRVRVFHLTSST